jgi:hypothetical protein
VAAKKFAIILMARAIGRNLLWRPPVDGQAYCAIRRSDKTDVDRAANDS